MNIASVDTGTISTSASSTFQQRASDFKTLAQSLQSGDLSGAQSAFASLQQLAGAQSASTQASTTASSSTNPIASDFASLGQALGSGDLSSAQQAFAKLQQDMQGVHGGHHHHHGHGTAQPTTAQTGSAPAASAPATSSLGGSVDVSA